jgi:hypothetical protein
VDTLAVRLAVPAIRVRRGLAPPSLPVLTTMTATAPAKALRAMPGAPTRKAGPRKDPPFYCLLRDCNYQRSLPWQLVVQVWVEVL